MTLHEMCPSSTLESRTPTSEFVRTLESIIFYNGMCQLFPFLITWDTCQDPESRILIATNVIDLSEVTDKPHFAFITFVWLILVENLKLSNV